MTRLRIAAGISAIALILISLLWMRLDSDALNTRITEEISHYGDSSIQAENTSLTFMHGFGLRLNQVTLDLPDVHVQAKHININVRLLPLLLGNIEVDTIDIHDGLFKLKSDTLALSATSISKLPAEHIHLIRSRIESANGTILLDNMQLELRGIGTEHETLWELNAQHKKQAISGHGKVSFHQGEIESGFGKIKLANMPVTKLHSLAPASLMHWIEGDGNNLSGSVTIDINKHQRWALFGEMMLKNKHTELAVKLRGKLSHLSDGSLIWKDSFIHLDEQAVIAIAGSCTKNNCSTTLNANNIELARWHQFIPKGVTFHRQVSATTELKASLKWNEQTWQGNATLELKEASFHHGEQMISLPALHLAINQLSGSTNTWIAKATISSPKIHGIIDIESLQELTGDKHMKLETHDSDSALWQPLANLLLSSLDLEPKLQASGSIKGTLHLHQHAKEKMIALNIDATATQIHYKPWLTKKADTVARCQMTINFSESNAHAIKMNDCQLDLSQITALTWSQKNKRQQLVIEDLALDFDSLQRQSILLPEYLTAFRGQLEGSGRSSWKGKEHWTNKMRGEWQLKNLGTEAWHANGTIYIKNGLFRSTPLLINGIYGKAQLKGSYSPAKNRGNIDVITASLNWNSLPNLPPSAQQIFLRGDIKQAELTLLNNQWSNIESHYQFSDGALTLKKLKSSFASGSFTSQKLTLSAGPVGLNIEGDLRGKNIQPDQLQGLEHWLKADLHGNLQANISLHGQINQTGISSDWQKNWRRSNGDILIYSGEWKQQLKAISLSERLGLKAPALKSYAFKKLEFRFRMFENRTDISGITLISHEQSYLGESNISSDLHLSGTIRHKESQSSYIVDSQLPQIDWHRQ